MDKKMKRIMAFLIDIFTLNMFFLIVVFSLHRYVDFVIVMGIFIDYSVIWVWLEFFLFDYFMQGSSIGKKVVGIRLKSRDGKFDLLLSVKHSIFKTIAAAAYPITFIYFLCKDRLFYDNYLKLEVIEKR